MYTVDSVILAKAIDNYCRQEKVLKKDFHSESGISSATLTQWKNEDYLVSAKSIKKLESYLQMPLKLFVSKYSDNEYQVESAEDDEVMALREELRRRPETKILFHASKNAPASAILEAAALIERYKEESKYK